MTPDPMAEIRATFFLECEELLETLQEGLDALSNTTGDDDTIHAIFRAVHSIKGGAGAFGLDRLVTFSHRVENTLDLVRSAELEIDSDLISLLFRATDLLSDLIRAGQTDCSTDTTAENQVLEALSSYCGSSKEPEDTVSFEPMGLVLDISDDLPEPDKELQKEITFHPDMAMFLAGHEPLHSLRALKKLGGFDLVCCTESIPELKSFVVEEPYFHWTLKMPANVDDGEVEAVFEFVDGLCEFVISSEDTIKPTEPPASGTETAPADPDGEIKAVPQDQPVVAVPDPDGPKETVPVANSKTDNRGPAPTVRVELERIDRLVNLVGELVINQAMISQSAAQASLEANSPIHTGLDEFLQLTRDIQDSVMMIRAQPVKSLFQRMGRIVREAGSATEKTVRLQLEGEDTEIDKTVLEKLVDPLTHMIRNAVDHGIETPEMRRLAGKPSEGTVKLTARHRSGRVIIEVRDDGAGLNREKILAKAINRGLLDSGRNLSESEIDSLLFLPGFSTVEKVSDLSGRGVGMDVVKRSIHLLGGRVSISSMQDEGTCISISLPLTLAILDGMIVSVSDQVLVMPLSAIVETLSLDSIELFALDHQKTAINLRGQVIPIFDLGTQLGYRDPDSLPKEGIALVLHSDDESDFAIMVDDILDQRQVVIKGLQESYGYIPGVAAATILGDGQISLILDPVALKSLSQNEFLSEEKVKWQINNEY